MLKKLKKILCPAFVFTAFSAVNVFAEGETQQANPLAMVMQFVPLVLIFVVFYFLLIRPQKKKEKALKDMISSLKVGDTVASIGGIHGKIIRIKDDVFVLESGLGANKSYISLDRSAISRLVKEGKNKNVADEDVAPIPDDDSSAEE
ncbi:MAG: preprotein translocase subunit YajC [Eubacteriales bacterium]|nr:preprotein translocase subunit YajC [Eubacteriales bacterium]MDY4213704.1 preprotein translocase subunit YajC [Eubacteriales bacterium]MDY5231038.1 preprotein translocase subunit YajC [Eubacteriales bacterium]